MENKRDWLKNGSKYMGLFGLYVFSLFGVISTAAMNISLLLMLIALIPNLTSLYNELKSTKLILLISGFLLYLGLQTYVSILWVPEIAQQQLQGVTEIASIAGLPAIIVAWWVAGNKLRIKLVLLLVLLGLTINFVMGIDWALFEAYVSGRRMNPEHGPNAMAFYAVIVLLGLQIFTFFYWKKLSCFYKLTFLVLFVFYFMVFIFCQSRSSWIAYFIVSFGQVVYGLKVYRDSWKPLIKYLPFVITFLALLSWIAAPMLGARFGEELSLQSHSVYARFDAWRLAVEMFLQKPLLGWGAGSAKYLLAGIPGNSENLTLPHFHNLYLQLLVTLGILGTLWLSFIYIHIYKKMLVYVNEQQKLKAVAIFSLSASSAFLISSFFQIRHDEIWSRFAIILITAIPLSFYFKKLDN